MVKTNRSSNRPSSSFNKPRPSGGKANAAGYAKRQSRKAKTLHGLQDSDIYEYKPEKVRRSKVTLELGRDEAAEFGGGEDVEEDREEMRARLIGENGEDEQIDSGDDEEIDSDAAFEESDDERYAGFSFGKGRKKATTKRKKVGTGSVRFADVNLNEDEEMDGEDNDDGTADVDDDEDMEEDGDDDEFIDVLDVLDGRGEVDDESDSGRAVNTRSLDAGQAKSDEEEASEEEQDDESEDGEENSDVDGKLEIPPSDEEDAYPEALDDLQNFISALDPAGKKRKAPTDDILPEGSEPRTRKRRMIKERTEAGVENEFRAQTSGSKLNLDDLLAPLSSQSSTLLSLKKSTKALGPSVKTKLQTLAAPLPQRTQERLDREAAYEQTKEEVDKWKATMQRIREAEHLSFPLQAEPGVRTSNLELAARFKPTTALESSVDALLKSAKMREEDIEATEDNMLQMKHLSVEEVAQRRGELRKMRELMFRAEVKAKRIGKIKSKTYRRLKRREKERLGEKLNEGVESDEGEEGRLKREVERAKERATLRHKNTGKWAKAMHRKEGLDIDERKDIEEMLARGERLRRKIHGRESDESGDGESEDEDEGGAEGGMERIKAGAFEEIEKINAADDQAALDQGAKGKGKSIFEMKFMKDAMARAQLNADRTVDDFIKEMGGGEGDDVDSEDEAAGKEVVDQSGDVAVERTGGRVVYRPGTAPNQQLSARPLGSLASDTSSVTLKSTDLLSPPPSEPQQVSRPAVPISIADDSNPWLVPRDPDAAVKAPRKKNEVIVEKESAAIEKSKSKLKKRAKKREEEQAKAKDDAVVEISMANVLTLGDAIGSASHEPEPEPKEHKKGKSNKTDAPPLEGNKSQKNIKVAENDSDVNSEVEEQEKLLDRKGKGKAKAKGPKAFEQRDLVALAFAGDNVVQQFEDAKRREIAADAPREVDTTLPGWGAWGGTGTRKQPPKPHLIKKIAGVDPSSRADYNKAHVIISEKKDKKAAKYLVKDLPYPYTSKAQFERSMDRPLGAEWNTRIGFQRGTLPKVVKKMGTIINPLEKLF